MLETILLELSRRQGGLDIATLAKGLRSGSRRVRLTALKGAESLGYGAKPVYELVVESLFHRDESIAHEADRVSGVLETAHGVKLPGEAGWRQIAALFPEEWSYRLPREGDEFPVIGPQGIVND